MAPSRKTKVIGGTAVALVALGAGTGLARSDSEQTKVELDDLVPISHVSAPAPVEANTLDFQFEVQDSVASPFDTSDDIESVSDQDTVQSIESPDDTPESADSPESVDSPETFDSPDDSPESADTPDDSETADIETIDSVDSPDNPESADSPDSVDSDD